MIRVNFDPKEFFKNAPPEVKAEWDELNKKARVATLKIIGEWEDYRKVLAEWQVAPPETRTPKPPVFKPAFEQTVWTGFKNWMKVNLFNNKCAYCEIQIVGFIADAEHFRPKAEVRYNGSLVKIVDEDGNEIEHPGYFWLAYNWKNLLPSCHICNRYDGKMTNFPAESHRAAVRLTTTDIDNLLYQEIKSLNADDVYYLEPEDLDALEKRSLLHPIFDKPEDYLQFNIVGAAEPKGDSAFGKESIEVLDLNQKEKVTVRHDAQIEALKSFNRAVEAEGENSGLEMMKAAGERALREYFRGRRPFAAAAFDYIRVFTSAVIAPDRDELVK